MTTDNLNLEQALDKIAQLESELAKSKAPNSVPSESEIKLAAIREWLKGEFNQVPYVSIVHGIRSVLDWSKTAQANDSKVLDVHLMTKSCSECGKLKLKLAETAVAFGKVADRACTANEMLVTANARIAELESIKCSEPIPTAEEYFSQFKSDEGDAK